MSIVKDLFKKAKDNKKWVAGFIISVLMLIVAIKALYPMDKQQLMKPVRICYVNVEWLREFKEKGEIGGKKINIIENEIVDIANKWTLPDSYIGFLILEAEQDVKLTITNLEIPYKCQKDTLYVSTGFVSQNETLNKENSIYKDSVFTRKSFSFDELMMFPFCITDKIDFGKKITPDKNPELFNNSNHIVVYYDISVIRYKTNGSDKWQSICVKPMESVIFSE